MFLFFHNNSKKFFKNLPLPVEILQRYQPDFTVLLCLKKSIRKISFWKDIIIFTFNRCSNDINLYLLFLLPVCSPPLTDFTQLNGKKLPWWSHCKWPAPGVPVSADFPFHICHNDILMLWFLPYFSSFTLAKYLVCFSVYHIYTFKYRHSPQSLEILYCSIQNNISA